MGHLFEPQDHKSVLMSSHLELATQVCHQSETMYITATTTQTTKQQQQQQNWCSNRDILHKKYSIYQLYGI